jgi:hypothetical protein
LSSATNGSASPQPAKYNPELGRELYALLVMELLLPWPGVERLIIIPDDGLWSVPFESLIKQASGEDAVLKARGHEAWGDAPAVTYYQAATGLPSFWQKQKGTRFGEFHLPHPCRLSRAGAAGGGRARSSRKG